MVHEHIPRFVLKSYHGKKLHKEIVVVAQALTPGFYPLAGPDE